MAISNLFLKGTLAVGSASVISLGGVGIYEYRNETNAMTKWDESILRQGTWSATSSDTEPSKITVSINSTDAKINNKQSWTWECMVKADSSASGLKDKLETLKTSLGITDPQTNTKVKERRQFIHNCARHRTLGQKEMAGRNSFSTSSQKLESAITIKVSDFEKLFIEEVNKAQE